MAFTMTNRGMYYMLTAAFTSGTTTPDLRMAVFKGTVPAVGSIRTMNFLSEVTSAGMTEAAATGYTRTNTQLDLTLTVTEEPSGANSVTISAPAPVLTAVAAGETWTAVAYYCNNGGADSTKELVGIDVPTPPTLATNGADVTLPALLITITGS
jgi:hypothetical protein